MHFNAGTDGADVAQPARVNNVLAKATHEPQTAKFLKFWEEKNPCGTLTTPVSWSEQSDSRASA